MLTGSLEYLMCSLPNLYFSDAESLENEVYSLFQKYNQTDSQSLTLDHHLAEEASKFLSKKDFQYFQSIELNKIHENQFTLSKNEVVSGFCKFMSHLKNELKTFRLARKSEDSSNKINYLLIQTLPENPLEAEKQLIKIQWQQLDDLSIGNYSNLSALILYKLKLQLLMRWWSFDKEEGFNVFQKSLNSI